VPFTPENKSRPFCSERCRLIDLGKWAADEYRLPEKADKEKSGSDPDSS
jgi:endogenous inhibitor of DNA gyrase (YacG/DUF329 family)